VRGLETPNEIHRFLDARWQQKPVVLKQALPWFVAPFDGNDLAGLACEPNVESRLVRGNLDHGYSVQHGPFSDEVFATLEGDEWTLLVQDVDKFSEEVAELWQHLLFLPRWRHDDIMISYSTPGGGVGPHEDQYDVFLLQASGTRRWQWAHSFDPALRSGDLKVLKQFTAEQEIVLTPGDVLYLPPGVAHHGVTLEAGLTYSFGFRSPSQRDLAIHLADQLVDRADNAARVRDPRRSAAHDSSCFSDDDRRELRQLVRSAIQLSDDTLDEILGQYLTRPKENLEHTTPPEALLAKSRCVRARFGSCWLHWSAGESHCFSVDGECFHVPSATARELQPICQGSFVVPPELSPEARAQLSDWWQHGYLEGC